jgi:hypothetical protein
MRYDFAAQVMRCSGQKAFTAVALVNGTNQKALARGSGQNDKNAA